MSAHLGRTEDHATIVVTTAIAASTANLARDLCWPMNLNDRPRSSPPPIVLAEGWRRIHGTGLEITMRHWRTFDEVGAKDDDGRNFGDHGRQPECPHRLRRYGGYRPSSSTGCRTRSPPGRGRSRPRYTATTAACTVRIPSRPDRRRQPLRGPRSQLAHRQAAWPVAVRRLTCDRGEIPPLEPHPPCFLLPDAVARSSTWSPVGANPAPPHPSPRPPLRYAALADGRHVDEPGRDVRSRSAPCGRRRCRRTDPRPRMVQPEPRRHRSPRPARERPRRGARRAGLVQRPLDRAAGLGASLSGIRATWLVDSPQLRRDCGAADLRLAHGDHDIRVVLGDQPHAGPPGHRGSSPDDGV